MQLIRSEAEYIFFSEMISQLKLCADIDDAPRMASNTAGSRTFYLLYG